MSNKEQLLQILSIQNVLLDQFTSMDESTKEGMRTFSKQVEEILSRQQKFSAYQLQTLANDVLTYWNETIRPETEKFWETLRANNIVIKRKEPLRFALLKKRFPSVEQGIDASNHWQDLKHQPSILANYTAEEIAQIDQIILADKDKRLQLLKKCLNAKKIPFSQYLKFGEGMAYFARCHLFDAHFSKEETAALYEIWNLH